MGRNDSQASANASPFALMKSTQVFAPVICAQLSLWPGTPAVFHTPSAQSPLVKLDESQPFLGFNGTHQSVVSKIVLWLLKNFIGSQFVDGQCAMGRPQFSGVGAFEVRSVGTASGRKK
jgi:hypothetical protein